MHLRRPKQQIVAAFTAMVLLFAALAPSVAGALGITSPAMWVELCSADGSKRVVLDPSVPNGSDDRSAAQRLSEHRPFLPSVPRHWFYRQRRCLSSSRLHTQRISRAVFTPPCARRMPGRRHYRAHRQNTPDRP